MSDLAIPLPAAHLLEWRERTLVYRPSEATLHWASPPETIGETLWRPTNRFEPHCLTVTFQGPCVLACSYCYGRRADRREPGGPVTAPLPAVAAAARRVAATCQQLGRPLLVGLHGSSEPLRHRAAAERVVEVVRRVAADSGLPLRLACTTSGVLEPDTVQWLADTFSSVTVSLDGAPAIHDRQRPRVGGGGSYDRVASTLNRLLSAAHRPEEVAVRCTITRASAALQVEIMEHILHRFAVDRVLFHPVYAPPGARAPQRDAQAPEPASFIAGFLAARQVARREGVDLVLASSRVNEVHGRFCPILQHSLTLTPGGHATACFLALDDRSASDQQLVYGAYDADSDQLVIDQQRLQTLLDAGASLPLRCRSCFAVWHCAKGCPDRCPVAPEPVLRTPSDRSCQIARQVAFASLLEAAGIELTSRDINELAQKIPIGEPA